MKLSAVLETVVDLQQRREQKTKQKQSQIMQNIDYAIEATIDQLKSEGMDGQTAYRVVMDHLSDLVMAHDLHDKVID